MSKIKLIAMDMDGTLLDDRQHIPKENLTALKQAVAQGVHIAICSGRSASDVSYFASDAGLDQCSILALNGACCLKAPHQEPYSVSNVKAQTADRVVDILLKHKVTFACFQKNRVVVLQNDYQVQKLNWGTHVARNNANAYAYGIESLERFKNEGICKFVYIDEDGSPRIEMIRQELIPLESLFVTSSWSNNLELMPQGVSKGVALQDLAQRLGINQDEVMAMGDYDNDLDMIEYAGFGVAMGNASDRVKHAAKHITLTNEENGVAVAIRRFVFTS